MIHRFDVFLVSLDPTRGAEIQKTRPCVVVSPDELSTLRTVIVAPLTPTIKDYPFRVTTEFQGKTGSIALDQIRTIDKSRLVKKLGVLERQTSREVLSVLREMFEE